VSKTIRRALISALCAFTIIGPTQHIAHAGTTGNITGIVQDSVSNAPISAASVSAVSPSQTATSHTDGAGRFAFISLAPDTYTVTAAKAGYQTVTTAGISVFADQSQNVILRVLKTAKTLGTITTTASSLSPVRAGTTTDVYSVNPALTQAAATLGGGGGMNNVYSGIASMPGAFVPPNQLGVNQTVYIRGGYYDQIGYEFDGVPVNRSFDNYPSTTGSTIGQQELEMYVGGGSASSNATGLAGFINQVVKSGPAQGYADTTLQIGTPTFYNAISLETGGSTTNRLFSYYLGFSGFGQSFRYLNNDNGANLVNEFPATYPSNITTNLPFWPAVYPTCDATNPNLYTNPAASSLSNDPGCFGYVGPNIDFPSSILSNAGVANFHIGVPHKRDSGKDDIQLLYSNSSQFLQYYSSFEDAQPLLNGLITAGDAWLPQWPDFYTYAPGTNFLARADTPVVGYAFPGSPTNRCLNQSGAYDGFLNYFQPPFPVLLPIPNGCPSSALSTYPPGVSQALPLNYRDGRWDSASIAKAQYQWNFDTTSYLRVFGYIFYSDTNRSGAVEDGITGQFGSINLGGTNYEYTVSSHTRGGEAQYAKQLSWQHQLVATLNYTTATTQRLYNFNDFNTATQQVSNLTNGTQCFASMDGTLANGIDSVTAGQAAPCNDPITQGTFFAPTGVSNGGNPENVTCSGGSNDPIPAPACTQNAYWALTFTGNQAEINSIKPVLGNISVADDWRPNERLVVNASLRFDRDEYDLTPVADAGKNFWYAAAQKEFCYDPTTFAPVLVPEAPQDLHSVNPYVSFTCPMVNGVQSVHPDGLDGHVLLTDSVPSSYVQNYFQPRIGMTYTIGPNTVLRASAGRYAQQPQNYEVQYNSLEPNLAAQLIGFLPFGYNTPFHPVQAQFSNNYDISYEHNFPGSDIGLKFTPYYRWATNQLYSANIATLFGVSPSFNAGTERVDGVELQVTKGDFRRNGLSGVFSYTYTNAAEKWSNYQGVSVNAVDPYNQDIQNYNALTKAGGGAPCYANSADGTADPTCASTSILNPYYNMQPQPLFDKNGWYTVGLDAPYVSPNTFALVLSYRYQRFSVTPALSLNEGAQYGTPADFQGLDPRTCYSNQSTPPINIPSAPNPLTADYTSCSKAAVGAGGTSTGYLFIPNPTTGTFDGFGQFRQPWQMNFGMQFAYDLSRAATVNLTVVNLVNSCFGGSSEPWTAAYPPNGQVCGYGSNKFFISNFYNGASPNDTAANGVPLNKYFTVPFAPSYGDVNSSNLPMPTQLFLSVNFKV
jgi:hypothetical protein